MTRIRSLQTAQRARTLLIVASAIGAPTLPLHAQLSFRFVDQDPIAPNALNAPGASIDAKMMAGIEQAAQRWSSLFSNHVTLSIDVNFKPLADGVIASTNWTPDFVSYSAVRNALVSHASTNVAREAAASLPNGSSFALVTNHTQQDPNAGGKAPYIDNNGSANNSTICLTQGDARALSLFSATSDSIDATITFNSNYATRFDFDPSDGISGGQLDFVGTATHELGHALGFTSGIDTLDFYARTSTLPEDALPDVTALDLFRYSALSHTDHAIDWSADSRTKYFSIDGGKTPLAFFSTGEHFGDGGQASHWEQGVTLGIMDPDSDFGEKLSISSVDRTAFNVIGWNFSSVPEPETYGWAALGALALVAWRRKRLDRKN
ncbi:MAG TPA: NF038122 family metalloprotease [Opitutaceae bacterium]